MSSYLVTFSGTLYSSEIFSHTLAVDSTGLSNAGEVLDMAVPLLEDVMTDSSAWGGLLDSTTVYTEVSVAQINLTTGHVGVASRADVDLPGDSGGISGGVNMPPQIAICVSLTAGTYASGKTVRGRFYIPGPLLQMDTQGRFNTAQQAAALKGAGDLVFGFNNETELTAPQVWSRADGTTHTVETVRVGRIADTVRSRRNSLPEEYATYS